MDYPKNLKGEKWKDIEGFPNYMVSNMGRFYSFNWNRLICYTYDRVTLCHKGKTYRPSAGVIILEAFVGPRPKGMMCCHKDDNRLNNKLSNLYWGTGTENYWDAVKNGHRPKNLTEETKAKMKISQNKRYLRPEERTKRIQQIKNNWANPETRRKMIEGIKKAAANRTPEEKERVANNIQEGRRAAKNKKKS